MLLARVAVLGRICSPAPHFLCNFDDQPQLGELLVFGQTVALARACEAALRAKAQLVKTNIFGGLVDPAFQQVFGFRKSIKPVKAKENANF